MKNLLLVLLALGATSSAFAGNAVCANQEAREKMTAVLNFHRQSAGLGPVSEETLFGSKSFETLGELKNFLWTSPYVHEADRSFAQSEAPASNIASWAMSRTIDGLAKPSTKITAVFCNQEEEMPCDATDAIGVKVLVKWMDTLNFQKDK